MLNLCRTFFKVTKIISTHLCGIHENRVMHSPMHPTLIRSSFPCVGIESGLFSDGKVRHALNEEEVHKTQATFPLLICKKIRYTNDGTLIKLSYQSNPLSNSLPLSITLNLTLNSFSDPTRLKS